MDDNTNITEQTIESTSEDMSVDALFEWTAKKVAKKVAKKTAVKKIKNGSEGGTKTEIDHSKIKIHPDVHKTTSVDKEKAAEAARLQKELKDHDSEIKKYQKMIDQHKKNIATKKKTLNSVGKFSAFTDEDKKYISLIEKECSTFIKDMKTAKKFLYRGTTSTKSAFLGTPYTKREAKDSDKELQAAFDENIKLLGFKALRSNSSFTSANEYQARNYGKLFIIFPKNGFNFTWSQNTEDLVLEDSYAFGKASKYLNNDDDDWEIPDEYSSLWETIDNLFYGSSINQVMNRFIYIAEEDFAYGSAKAKAVEGIIKSNKADIVKMIEKWKVAGSYNKKSEDKKAATLEMYKMMLAFRTKTGLKFGLTAFDINSAKKWIDLVEKEKSSTVKKINGVDSRAISLETAKNLVKEYKLSKEDMPAALKSNHEICVSGEYYAFEASKFKKKFNLYFFNISDNGYEDEDEDYLLIMDNYG